MSPCERWIGQLLDRSQPVSVRLEAVERIAEQCRDYNTFQTIRWLVDYTADDLSLRSAIVRAFPRWDETCHPTMAVVHALSLPELRAVAIETLDRMGPVTGSLESRLLSELASLKPGASKHLRLTAMPVLYGRDPRLLHYLREILRSGNRWERALSASMLYQLGEEETALTAAADPEPRVRKSLARAQGTASEDAFDWTALLKELSEFRLTDDRVTATLPEERIRSGWLGEPAATAAHIQALEKRIGRALPPSYRAFLEASNGFQQQSSFISRMYRAEEVDWFEVRHAEWAHAYRETYPHLGSCLQVSDVGDAAVVLLNPGKIDAHGEWETYFFANWMAGARPHASFRAFMEKELDGLCEWSIP